MRPIGLNSTERHFQHSLSGCEFNDYVREVQANNDRLQNERPLIASAVIIFVIALCFAPFVWSLVR